MNNSIVATIARKEAKRQVGGEEFRGIRNWKFVMDAKNSDVSGYIYMYAVCIYLPQPQQQTPVNDQQ